MAYGVSTVTKEGGSDVFNLTTAKAQSSDRHEAMSKPSLSLHIKKTIE